MRASRAARVHSTSRWRSLFVVPVLHEQIEQVSTTTRDHDGRGHTETPHPHRMRSGSPQMCLNAHAHAEAKQRTALGNPKCLLFEVCSSSTFQAETGMHASMC